MIEKIVRDYLEKSLTNIPVKMEHPKTKPETYIVIEKTGSGENNQIDSATIAIQSIADSLYKAAELNEQIKSYMKTIIDLPEISRVSLNTDYNYTDSSTKQYRYQAIFDITYY